MDRVKSLAVFVAAVDEGSLAAAGRRFGLSPAMAGKHLDALEAQLGARLLQRTTRRLSLTEVGRGYYARCKRILDDLDDADREAKDLQTSPRGSLCITAPVTFGALHLGGSVARYLADCPDVNVTVTLTDRFVDLLESGVDVAVRIGRLPDSELVARRIAPCRMLVCASPAYLARHGTPTTPEALRRAARLCFSEAVSPGDWTFVDADGREHAVTGSPRLAVNNMQMLLEAALAGAGVAYGPSFVLSESLARGELVALLPDFRTAELTVYAVVPTARHVSLKVRTFLDRLTTDLGDPPPWDRALSTPAVAAPRAAGSGRICPDRLDDFA